MSRCRIVVEIVFGKVSSLWRVGQFGANLQPGSSPVAASYLVAVPLINIYSCLQDLTRYARPTLEQERALAPPGWVGGRLSETLGSLGPSQEFVTRVGRPVQATTSADWVACEDPPAEQWPARADEVRLASYHDCQSASRRAPSRLWEVQPRCRGPTW
jgi:hypothetical protein